jgi:hypothetical protein
MADVAARALGMPLNSAGVGEPDVSGAGGGASGLSQTAENIRRAHDVLLFEPAGRRRKPGFYLATCTQLVGSVFRFLFDIVLAVVEPRAGPVARL